MQIFGQFPGLDWFTKIPKGKNINSDLKEAIVAVEKGWLLH